MTIKCWMWSSWEMARKKVINEHQDGSTESGQMRRLRARFYDEHITTEKTGKKTNRHIGWPAPSPKKNKQDTAKSEIMGHDLPPKKNSTVRDSEQTKKTRQHQTMTDIGHSPLVRNKQQPKWQNQVKIWITIKCEKRSVSQVARKTVMNDQQGPTGETT